MLALSGSGTETLSGDFITVEIGVPAAATSFELGIYDGDTSLVWDSGSIPMDFTICADPGALGAGTPPARSRARG